MIKLKSEDTHIPHTLSITSHQNKRLIGTALLFCTDALLFPLQELPMNGCNIRRSRGRASHHGIGAFKRRLTPFCTSDSLHPSNTSTVSVAREHPASPVSHGRGLSQSEGGQPRPLLVQWLMVAGQISALMYICFPWMGFKSSPEAKRCGRRPQAYVSYRRRVTTRRSREPG